MMPTRSPGLMPRSCSSPATRALASSSARYVIAALSTRTATRPAQARVVSVRFLARFVTLLLSGRGPGLVVGLRYQACPQALVRRNNRCAVGPSKRPIYVLPARYRRVPGGLASWITPRKGPIWRPSAAARRGAEHRGVRCPDRDPAGQPEQV